MPWAGDYEMGPGRVHVTPPPERMWGADAVHVSSQTLHRKGLSYPTSWTSEEHDCGKPPITKTHLPFYSVPSHLPKPRQMFLRLCCVCRRMSISGSLTWIMFGNLCELVKRRHCAFLKTAILLKKKKCNSSVVFLPHTRVTA